MKNLIFISFCLISVIGCQSSAKPKELLAVKGGDKTFDQNAVTVVDTGQAYFKVVGTKNGQPLINYEGDYPTATRQDTFFTVGLGASRDVSVWSDMLAITIYSKQMATGSFPVVGILYAEEGKATMLLTSPTDGNVSQPKKGTVTITKFTDSLFSGKFEGKSNTQDGSEMGISGVFLNVKYK
jgi:hypothetical protein